MSRSRMFAVVGVLAKMAVAMTAAMTATMTATTTGALAADMPGTLPPPYIEPLPPRLISLNTGWYVRGDLGYRWGITSGAESTPPFANPTDNTFGNGAFGGIGFGIKSTWLRTDVTVDYGAPLTYEGSVAASNDTTAKVTAVTALFNGYLDLGTWYRATPYLGGGAGVAQLRVSDYTSTAAPPFAGGLSHTQWNFAWAGMAGVAYAVAPNLLVDVGYRYLNFGDAHTASDSFGSMTLKNLAAHEVRVGVRWSFDDLPALR